MKSRRSREERRAAAEEMAKARAGRTPQEQLDRLNQRFGSGNGATKERAKIQRQIHEVERATKTYHVKCRVDSDYNGSKGQYVLATRQLFFSQKDATEYAKTIHESREPQIFVLGGN